MRFLVTGSKGFVGRHMIELLESKGHEAVGTNCHDESLLQYRYDGIFHLGAATYPPASFEDPAFFFYNNAMQSVRMIDKIGNTPFMYCSTSEVYGQTEEIITESTPLIPNNPYAVSKAATDMYCRERMQSGAMRGFITRAFSHVGKYRLPRYAYASDAEQIAKIALLKQAPVLEVGNLNAERNVMDVRDVVEVYYRLMIENINGSMDDGEVFNICGNKTRKYGEYVYMMLNSLPPAINVALQPAERLMRKIDIITQRPDSTKVRKFLNWQPLISIETTMSDLVDHWKEKIYNAGSIHTTEG
jgi:GDP-4-dehydro-6-deoxy-D-mannose reductase